MSYFVHHLICCAFNLYDSTFSSFAQNKGNTPKSCVLMKNHIKLYCNLYCELVTTTDLNAVNLLFPSDLSYPLFITLYTFIFDILLQA